MKAIRKAIGTMIYIPTIIAVFITTVISTIIGYMAAVAGALYIKVIGLEDREEAKIIMNIVKLRRANRGASAVSRFGSGLPLCGHPCYFVAFLFW